MDIHIDVSSNKDHKFSLYARYVCYELSFGGLTIEISDEQFKQLCDNLRPWIVEQEAPE